MLVDPQFHRPSIKEKTLSRIDSAIEDILQSDIPDDEKVKRYTIALNKYRAIDQYEPRVSESLKKEDFESDVIQSVPLAQQYKAKRLLDYLKKDPDIQWSDRGELIHRQNLVRNSNVVDLISDLLRKSTTTAPDGWQEVAQSLAKSNVAKEFVTNAKRWKHIRDSLANDAADAAVASVTRKSPATPTPTTSSFAPTPKTPSKVQQKSSSKKKTRRSKKIRLLSPVSPSSSPTRKWLRY